jgi:hypothetical protein
MIQQLPLEYQVPGREEYQAVLRVSHLIEQHRGRTSAISMHRIAEVTGLQTRLIQAIVKFLVEERHMPIGTAMSKPFGYFILETDDERRRVRDHFVRRAVSNLEHARAYDSDSIVAPILGQLELAFPKEQ